MYVGHALLAFAVGAAAARLLGVDARRSLWYGAAAGGFGLVPHVDVAAAAAGAWLTGAGPAGLLPPDAGGATGAWAVHRSLSHSLLTGAVGAVFAGHVAALVLVRPAPGRRLPPPTALAAVPGLVGLAGGLAWVAWVTAGMAGVATMLAYVAAAALVAWLAVRRGGTALGVAGAAAVGLLAHPFGDGFGARSPALLYPLVAGPALPTLSLSADPTANLVGLFLLEVALAWLAAGTAAWLTGWSLRRLVRPGAVLGLGFAATAPVVAPPTVAVASPFALGVLATGALLGLPTLAYHPEHPRVVRTLTAVSTGLAAATLATVGYLAAYLVVG